MKNRLFASFLFLSLSACGGGDSDNNMASGDAPGAEKLLYSAALLSAPDADGKIADAGSARISDKDGGTLHIALKSMKAGSYAMHLHSIGQCDGPDFKSAGGHWNPDAVQHGRENPKGAHAGDLTNLQVEADGPIEMSYALPANTQANLPSLLDDDGAAFVIHAGPDDMKSDPAGDAGSRIICGILSAGEAPADDGGEDKAAENPA